MVAPIRQNWEQLIARLEQERQKIFDLHRLGKYSDDEFLEQKDMINTAMTHQRQLLQDNHVEEFDMDEALEYCFKFVRETSVTWLRFKKTNYEYLMRFQKLIFPGKLMFDGKKFENTELSLVYKLNQRSVGGTSNLVGLLYPEWHTLENTVLKWKRVFNLLGRSWQTI